MCRKSFAHFCEILRVQGGLVQLKQVTVNEQVAIFLYILARHKKKIGVSKLDSQDQDKQLVSIVIECWQQF